MGKDKRTRKFAKQLRLVNSKDPRVNKADQKKIKEEAEKKKALMEDPETSEYAVKRIERQSTALFFKFNLSLGPPYRVLVDTNFFNFSIQNKIDIIQGMMDCLYAKCIPMITECVLAELEKLGPKYRVALKIARDPRFEKLPCTHQGTYADDCIVQRVTASKCYIVATNDRDLKRRIRKIPGVPIMYVTQHKYSIERMPDATGNLPQN